MTTGKLGEKKIIFWIFKGFNRYAGLVILRMTTYMKIQEKQLHGMYKFIS